MSFRADDSRTYTVVASEVPVSKPWWEQEFLGVPIWVYIVAGAGLAGLVGIGMVVRK